MAKNISISITYFFFLLKSSSLAFRSGVININKTIFISVSFNISYKKSCVTGYRQNTKCFNLFFITRSAIILKKNRNFGELVYNACKSAGLLFLAKYINLGTFAFIIFSYRQIKYRFLVYFSINEAFT